MALTRQCRAIWWQPGGAALMSDVAGERCARRAEPECEHQLCWLHGHTVRSGMATLADVLAGRRKKSPADYRQKGTASCQK